MFILQIFKQARVKACTKSSSCVQFAQAQQSAFIMAYFWPSMIKDNHLLFRGRGVASEILLSHVSLFSAITDVNGL